MRLERTSRPDAKIEAGENTLIVEIGAGRSLHIQYAPETYLKEFEEHPSVKYYAIDWMEDRIEDGQNNAAVLHTDAARERIHFLALDGTRLPFKNASVTEVIMENVLGGGTSVPDGLIEEAARVLKQGGLLKIVDYYTPWLADKATTYMNSYPGAFVPVSESEAKPPIDETSLNQRIRESTTYQKTKGRIEYFRRV